MKFLQSILVMFLFVSLGAPCVHGEEHSHHDRQTGIALHAAAHCSDCHSDAEEPCSKPQQAVTLSSYSPVNLPERIVETICIPKYKKTVPVVSTVPTLPLRFIQTVQLLI